MKIRIQLPEESVWIISTIVQMNSSLEYISEIERIQKPYRILLNEERGRLYVIEAYTKNLTVLDI